MKPFAKILLLAMAVVAAGGWIFRRTGGETPDVFSFARQGARVEVAYVAGRACDVARHEAGRLAAEGWTRARVSTGTFLLYTRGSALKTLLAEDTARGVRLTTLHCDKAL
jgi:hypothetical protein